MRILPFAGASVSISLGKTTLQGVVHWSGDVRSLTADGKPVIHQIVAVNLPGWKYPMPFRPELIQEIPE